MIGSNDSDCEFFQELALRGHEIRCPCFEKLVKFVDLLNGVEENKHLGFLVNLLVEVLVELGDDELVHFVFGVDLMEIVLHSFECNPLFGFVLDHLVNVALDEVLAVLLIVLQELFLHCG